MTPTALATSVPRIPRHEGGLGGVFRRRPSVRCALARRTGPGLSCRRDQDRRGWRGPPMRIAIGGIMHESNTFAPLPADRQRFEEGSWTRGRAMLDVWREAHHEMGGFIAGSESFGYELVPTVMAWATPS